MYIRERREVKHVVSVIDKFFGVSGLHTNRTKSMVIELNSQGLDVPLDTQGVTGCPLHGVVIKRNNDNK